MRVRNHKEGSLKQAKTTMTVAGVDVDKHRLHVAIHGSADAAVMDNTPEGVSELIAWMHARGVRRVGMEATGGYERAVRAAAEAAALEVVVHQPIEVRRFAQFRRLKAKNDKLDARLIAAATAQVEAVKAAADPRLAELAERLTVYDQLTDLAATLKASREHLTIAALKVTVNQQIQSLESAKKAVLKEVLELIKSHPDLAKRLRLLMSLTGIGPAVAATLVVRMPELGAMSRGQAASLLGVAPFDHDSGKFKGARHIGQGRWRPRKMIYIAALSAKRFDPRLKALERRLLDAGKPKKVAIVAVMRKLIEAANLVLFRQTPWIPAST